MQCPLKRRKYPTSALLRIINAPSPLKMYDAMDLYSARNLEMSIRFSLKSRPSERFHWPETSQIKAEISLRTNVKLNFHKNVGCQ